MASNLHCSAAEHPPQSQNSMPLTSAVSCGVAQEGFPLKETSFRKIRTSEFGQEVDGSLVVTEPKPWLLLKHILSCVHVRS